MYFLHHAYHKIQTYTFFSITNYKVLYSVFFIILNADIQNFVLFILSGIYYKQIHRASNLQQENDNLLKLLPEDSFPQTLNDQHDFIEDYDEK